MLTQDRFDAADDAMRAGDLDAVTHVQLFGRAEMAGCDRCPSVPQLVAVADGEHHTNERYPATREGRCGFPRRSGGTRWRRS